MQTRALIAYAGRGVARPRYYANDHSRDVLDIAPVAMEGMRPRTMTRKSGMPSSDLRALSHLTLDGIAGVVYLVSDGAAYVTGQTLNINGGMLMS